MHDIKENTVVSKKYKQLLHKITVDAGIYCNAQVIQIGEQVFSTYTISRELKVDTTCATKYLPNQFINEIFFKAHTI